MWYLLILFFNELVYNPALVLRFWVVYLADQLPNFSAETVALDGLEPLVKTLSDSYMTQMLYLKSQVCFNPITSFHFLDWIHQNNHPFILSVRFRQIQLIEGFEEEAVFNEALRVLFDTLVALLYLLVLSSKRFPVRQGLRQGEVWSHVRQRHVYLTLTFLMQASSLFCEFEVGGHAQVIVLLLWFDFISLSAVYYLWCHELMLINTSH